MDPAVRQAHPLRFNAHVAIRRLAPGQRNHGLADQEGLSQSTKQCGRIHTVGHPGIEREGRRRQLSGTPIRYTVRPYCLCGLAAPQCNAPKRDRDNATKSRVAQSQRCTNSPGLRSYLSTWDRKVRTRGPRRWWRPREDGRSRGRAVTPRAGGPSGSLDPSGSAPARYSATERP